MVRFILVLLLFMFSIGIAVIASAENELTPAELISVGDSLFTEWELSQAKTNYYSARDSYKEAGDELGKAQCNMRLAKIASFEGHFSQTQKLLADVKPVLEENGLYEDIFEYHRLLGDIFALRGQYDDAVRNYRAAADLGMKTGDSHLQCAGLRMLGNLSVKRCSYEGAKMGYGAAMQAAPGAVDSAYVYIGFGDTYAMEDKYPQSLVYLDSAQTLAEAALDSVLLAELYGAKASTYRRSGNYFRALDYYARQLEIAKTGNDKLGRAKTMMNMAVIFELQQQYAKAQDFMEEVVLLFSEMNSPETAKAKEFLKRLKGK